MGLALVAVGCGDDDSESASDDGAATQRTESGHPDFSGITLNYLGFGGSNDKAMRKAWFEPYEKLTGLQIRSDQPTDYKKLKIQQQSGNVQYDLVDGDAFVMDPGCGKEWEELNLPNIEDVLPEYRPGTKCTAPDYIYQYVIAYSPKAFPDGGPQNCQDFFDTAKFPGKRQAWSYYYGSIGECAAVAAGGDPANLYPMDMDALFGKLESIKGDLSLYDTDGQAADSMVNNDAAMGVYTTRMVFEALEQGADWKIAPGWAAVASGSFGVPKGAENKEAAEALLNYIMDKENNIRYAEELPIYGSVVAAEVPAAEDVEPPELVSGGPAFEGVAVHVDWDWWAQNDPAFAQEWTRVTSG
jgi:putative spermidine/putrescine transport system substrate-binding protein